MCRPITKSKTLFRRMFLPILAAVVVAGVTACGGGGGGGATASGPSSKLFIADSAHLAIASLLDPNPPTSQLSPDHVISGPNTGLVDPSGLAINPANGTMYVANGQSILVFNNAGTANGNVSPSRTITSAKFGNVSALFLDTAHNVLYAGDDLNGIWVIANASGANGVITPTRSITGTFGTAFVIHGLAVDTTRDLLYVSCTVYLPYSNPILVFDHASTANGNSLTALHTIVPTPSPNASINAGRLFLDAASDSLYMADSSYNRVRVFDAASSADGMVTPNRTINLPAPPSDLAVDTTNDRLYALNPGVLYIVGNASTADGTVPVTELVASTGSLLSAVAVIP